MAVSDIIALIALVLTVLSYIVYSTSRFTKLEANVNVLFSELQEFREIKSLVYKIHAQNEIMLKQKK